MYSARREPRHDPSKGDHHCSDCGEYFRTPGALFSHHKRIHLQQSRGDCVLCDLGFESGHYLKKHLGQVHGDKEQVPVRCSQCLVQFLSVDRLVKHASTHHSSKPDLSCRFCAKQFKRMINLRRHEDWHQGRAASTKQFTCPHCFKSCSQVGGLALHITRNHSTSEKPKTKCPFCAKEFTAYSDYTEHVVKHHGNGYKVMRKCNFCLKTFDSTRKCDEHCCRVHGKKDFRCPLCEEIFTDPQTGVRHLKTHEEVSDREFECTDCAELFGSVPMMIRHRMVAHPMEVKLDGTWERVPLGFMDLVTCGECGFQSLTWQQHTRHLRLKHADMKVESTEETSNMSSDFSCTICKEQFITREKLNEHCSESHKDVKNYADCVPVESEGLDKEKQSNKRRRIFNDERNRKKLKRMEDYICRTLGPKPSKNQTKSNSPEEGIAAPLVSEGFCVSFREDGFRVVEDIDPVKKRRLVCGVCQFIANNDMDVYEHVMVHCQQTDSTLFVVRRSGGLKIVNEKYLTHFLETKNEIDCVRDLVEEARFSVERQPMKATAVVIAVIVPSSSNSKPLGHSREIEPSGRCSFRIDFERSGDAIICRECQCPIDNLLQHTAVQHGAIGIKLTLISNQDNHGFSVIGTVEDLSALAKRKEDFLKSEQYEKLDRSLDFPPTRNSKSEGFRINFAKLNVSNADQTYDNIWCHFCVCVVPKDSMTDHLSIHNKEDDLYIEENEHAFSVYNIVAREFDDGLNAPKNAASTQAQDRQDIARILCELALLEPSEKNAIKKEPSELGTPKENCAQERLRSMNARVLIVPSRKTDKTGNDGIHVLFETLSSDERPIIRLATRKSDFATAGRSVHLPGHPKTKAKEYLNIDTNEYDISFVCHACRRPFADFQSLWEHARLQHNTEPGNAIFFCDKCPKVFEKKGYLKKHLQNFHHISDDLPPCPICQNTFSRLTDLGRHMTEHKNRVGDGNVNIDGIVTMDDSSVLADVENAVASRNLNETDENVRESSSPSSDYDGDITVDSEGDAETTSSTTDEVFQCSECDSRHATLAEALHHMNEAHTSEVFEIDGREGHATSHTSEPSITALTDVIAFSSSERSISENQGDLTSKPTTAIVPIDPSPNGNTPSKLGRLATAPQGDPVAQAWTFADEASSEHPDSDNDKSNKRKSGPRSAADIPMVSRFYQFSGTESDIEKALNLIRTMDHSTDSSLVVRECELI